MITLRKVAPEDFAQLARWLSDPQINGWLSSEWRNREVTTTPIAMLARNGRNALFLVLHEGAPCGMAAFSEIDSVDRTANVWYFLGERALAGKGITTAAVRELVRIGFSEMKFGSVAAWAMENNLASQKVLEKAGFKRAGRLRKSAVVNGESLDRIYYDLVEGEGL